MNKLSFSITGGFCIAFLFNLVFIVIIINNFSSCTDAALSVVWTGFDPTQRMQRTQCNKYIWCSDRFYPCFCCCVSCVRCIPFLRSLCLLRSLKIICGQNFWCLCRHSVTSVVIILLQTSTCTCHNQIFNPIFNPASRLSTTLAFLLAMRTRTPDGLVLWNRTLPQNYGIRTSLVAYVLAYFSCVYCVCGVLFAFVVCVALVGNHSLRNHREMKEFKLTAFWSFGDRSIGSNSYTFVAVQIYTGCDNKWKAIHSQISTNYLQSIHPQMAT